MILILYTLVEPYYCLLDVRVPLLLLCLECEAIIAD